MSMKFSFADCVTVQRHVRVAMQKGELTTSQTVAIVSEVFDRGPVKPHIPITAPRPEPEVAPRPKCLVHREIVHTFADGSTMSACTHSDCHWGSGHFCQITAMGNLAWNRKKHSDGLTFVIPEAPEEITEVGADDDDMPIVTETEDGEGVIEVEEVA